MAADFMYMEAGARESVSQLGLGHLVTSDTVRTHLSLKPNLTCNYDNHGDLKGGYWSRPTRYPAGSATREEMSAAKLPLAYRDSCAGYLIKLNECRRKNYFWPGSCDHDMHTYEKCQYAEFQRRVAKQKELKAQNDGARSN